MAHLIQSQKKMYNEMALEATQKRIEAQQAFRMLLYVLDTVKETEIRIDLAAAEKIDEKKFKITPEAIEDGEDKGKLKAITITKESA